MCMFNLGGLFKNFLNIVNFYLVGINNFFKCILMYLL